MCGTLSPSIMSIFLAILLCFLPVFFFFASRRSTKRLPPGSLGLPIIGQSLTLLRAMKNNTAERWLEERARKYGPISKLSLFGKPTVFVHGQAANRLIFTCDGITLANQMPQSSRMILGDRCLLDLNGQDHKRVRDALVSFLRPECLKQYVGKMDIEMRRHIENHWEGKEMVKVMALMKTLTFNIICSLLFGIENMAKRDALVDDFRQMSDGVWSIPVNLPFTQYNRSLKAAAKVRRMARDLVRLKWVELEKNGASLSQQDLITCLLSLRGENGKELVSEEEIVQNAVLVMLAGYETSSILITFIIRLLSTNPTVFAALLQEQEEIAKSKKPGELLNWEDLTKMKYTWRVAQETMRVIPPIFGGFRTATEDIEYGGYIIPKGWQVFWGMSMTHLDGSIFQEPLKFVPARFENPTSIPPYCFVPFAAGPRKCPGHEFAKIQTLIAIHYLVTRFTWKLCNTDNSYTRNPLPMPAQGLPIQIVPKKLF